MSLYLGENCISAGGSSAFKNNNIGEIIQSTIPLTDAGLHLLDGSLISGSGAYSAFVTYIASLVSSYPDLFETEANWQQSVTDYGVCGKFVYDSVNNTVRLPKYSNKIYTGGGTAAVVGNGMTLGLTNGTNNYGLVSRNATSANGVYGGYTGSYGKNVGLSGDSGSVPSAIITQGITTNPTKSGIIADLSNITTSLDGYYYIVIATSIKTDIEVDIDEIATDLNGKADVDFSNATYTPAKTDLSNINPTQTAKNNIVSWGMPDYSAGISISGTSYQAPKDGFACIHNSNSSVSQLIYVNNNFVGICSNKTTDSTVQVLINKNDTITCSGGFYASQSYFYPMKGVS